METPITPTAQPAISQEAFEKLKGCFDAPRWEKLELQAIKRAENLPSLCTALAATSAARYPDNELAAKYSAANRLLISLGSTLKPADVERFEAALNPNAAAPVTAEATVVEPLMTADEVKPDLKKRRGGKADAAPPPVS